jgi:ABC-2 type transport system ATP-binding protein
MGSVGFLPENPYVYPYLTPREFVSLCGRLNGMSGQRLASEVERVIERVGIGYAIDRRVGALSKGMLQRTGFAAAIVHSPELLILDEPMSGLDPFGRRDVRDLILEQRERGVTVMFSSHILPDVELLCDRVAIVLNGRLERLATVGELVDGQATCIEVRVANAPVFEVPTGWSGCFSMARRTGESVITLNDESRLQPLLALLVQLRVEVKAVTPQRGTLEDLFMNAARDAAFKASTERRTA